jgi:transposase InsO family protein
VGISAAYVLCSHNSGPHALSNRIVGYCIDSRMKSRLATALHNAVARRGEVAGCILHTDRGSQLRSRKFVHALGRHDMAGSMGRVGAAGDNAAMESIFSLLQKNVLDRRRWDTGRSCGSRSWPGSNAPTTAVDARPLSGG